MEASPLCAPDGGASLHVAIIMDGNGRWAAARGISRAAGHRQGAEAVRRVVEVAPSLGVGTLTLYAFSSDNWRRPPREVAALMRLFRSYLRAEARKLGDRGVRLRIIGRRDRLPLALRAAIEDAERVTAGGRRLTLRLAIDYSARDAIVRAAALAHADAESPRDRDLLRDDDCSRDLFAKLLGRAYAPGGAEHAADVDLLVRTGGERRLSDFLLWECAYAELHFTERMWPEFSATDLAAAIEDFNSRERRFGGLTAVAG